MFPVSIINSSRAAAGFFRLFKQLDHPVDDGFRARRAAGDINIHRDHLVDIADDVVAALEYAAGKSAGADRDDEFRVGHLLVDAQQPVACLKGHRSGADEHIRVARAALEFDPEAFDIVARRERGEDLDIAAVAGTAVEMNRPGRIDAGPGFTIYAFVQTINSVPRSLLMKSDYSDIYTS